MKVTRKQVLAYRVHAQQLDRRAHRTADLAVFDLGVQEAMGQPAALALAARLGPKTALGPGSVRVGPTEDLALVWSFRGAPHVHRRQDLDAVAAALWPLSEADAAARLTETGPSITRQGIAALEQFGVAVEQMRAVVTKPTAKGAVSTAVTLRLPEAMRRKCSSCKTSHISDSAMRAATLPAGLELEPGTAPPVLRRRRRAALPTQPDTTALTELALAYLRLLGPAGPGEFAGFLQARRADIEARWPEDLVPVTVDGRPAWLATEHVDDLTSAPAPELVRLLGPFDPYLQARDRDLLVPDKTVHKALWPVLGRPGVVLVDGEVAGTWRAKTSRSAITITVEAFAPLGRSTYVGLEAEAERVAEVRGASDVTVVRGG